MDEKPAEKNEEERRQGNRDILDKYYSVEFTVKGLDSFYQFKIRDMSENGMCLLINEDSKILKFIKAGDVINMKYLPDESSEGGITQFKTEIIHITKGNQGRFKKHSLVGLYVIEKN